MSGGLIVKVMKILKSRDCMSICEDPICQNVKVLNRPVKMCSMNLPTR